MPFSCQSCRNSCSRCKFNRRCCRILSFCAKNSRKSSTSPCCASSSKRTRWSVNCFKCLAMSTAFWPRMYILMDFTNSSCCALSYVGLPKRNGILEIGNCPVCRSRPTTAVGREAMRSSTIFKSRAKLRATFAWQVMISNAILESKRMRKERKSGSSKEKFLILALEADLSTNSLRRGF